MVLTPEGRVQEVTQPDLFSLHCRLKLGGPSQTSQHFSEFGGYPQTLSFSQRPMLDSRNCYGCGETGHIRRYCPKQSYRPPIVRGRGGHGRGRHSGGRGSQGNGGHQISWGGGRDGATAAQHGGSTGRQVIGPIVKLSPGVLKQRHLMLLSQVIFWSVIA